MALEGEALERVESRLRQAFRGEAAAAHDHVYQYRVGDEDLFWLRVHDGELEIAGGRHPDPSVTFFIDALPTALGILDGTVDAMGAFMEGRVRTDGHLILALQLGGLFRPAR